MSYNSEKMENLDLVGAFEQGWIQYKSNFMKLIPFGFLASVPMMLFFVNITAGVLTVVLFQGFLFIILANAVASFSSGIRQKLFTFISFVRFFKNGLILSLFLLPLLTIGFVILVVPSVFLFSLFMFSFFFIAQKDRFAVDACMESLREGFGYRLHLFLFSLIFYSSMVTIFMISEMFPPIFVILCSLFLPYIFSVMYELYEQLEKK